MEEDNDATTNADAFRNGQLDILRKLEEMATETKWRNNFIKALKHSEDRLDPFGLALLLKADRATLDHLYNPDMEEDIPRYVILGCTYTMSEEGFSFLEEKHAISSAADYQLSMLCVYSGNEDSICHMANEFPEHVAIYNYNLDEYPIQVAMGGRMAEHTIRALIEAWPECVATSMWKDSHENVTPIQKCLHLGYSQKLLDFMISKLSSCDSDLEISSDNYRPLRANDLRWIVPSFKNFPKIIKFGWLEWEGPKFLEFLENLFLKDNAAHGICIGLPHKIRGDVEESEHVASSMHAFLRLAEFKKDRPLAEKLNLVLPHASYMPLLSLLSQWPNLQELCVDVYEHLDQSIVALCRLVNKGALRLLQVKAKFAAEASRKRKCSSENVELPLRPLFDALALNASVESFVLCGLGSGQKQAHRDLLLDVVKKNTTLRNTKGFFSTNCCDFHDFDSRLYIEVEDCRSKVGYQLNLNACNRRAARTSSTTLGEFVSVLASVECTMSNRVCHWDGTPDDILASIYYGLLHEGIPKWANCT